MISGLADQTLWCGRLSTFSRLSQHETWWRIQISNAWGATSVCLPQELTYWLSERAHNPGLTWALLPLYLAAGQTILCSIQTARSYWHSLGRLMTRAERNQAGSGWACWCRYHVAMWLREMHTKPEMDLEGNPHTATSFILGAWGQMLKLPDAYSS